MYLTSTRGRRRRTAFTLVEMLVAMAVTLLMMAALAKAFHYIGEKVRDSRVEVTLSGRLRDVTHRLKTELASATVHIDPVTRTQQGDGYLVYFEGPLSDSSGITMGESPSAGNELTLQDSKFGDFDDYLAFTVKAEGNNVFHGKVPRFILDQRTVNANPLNNDGVSTNNVGYDPTSFPGGVAGALDPVVITSKYAEVIYFASPAYQTQPDPTDPNQRILVYDSTGNPQFVDNDGDLLPDRIQLHRRVLLVRPDLNLKANDVLAASNSQVGNLPTFNPSSYGSVPNFNYLSADNWAVDTLAADPAIKTQGTHGISQEQNSRAWLMGMGPVHQYCDLSVRRNMNANGVPIATVSANSLADLTRPENRFAHVRVPKGYVGINTSSVDYTSMPLLAMGGIQPLLQRAADPSNSVAPPLQGFTSGSLVTPLTLNGFLRPEFVLGWDYTHTDYFGDGWGIERLGEDVLASNVVGFDVQIFDPTVQLLLSPGADGGYGVATVDDNLAGGTDDISEAGASGSDDVLIGPSDPGYGTVLRTVGSGSSSPQPAIPATRGDFVDLFYALQAGGTMRGITTRRRDMHSTAMLQSLSQLPTNTVLQILEILKSDYSGFRTVRLDPSLASAPGTYPDGLYRSGRLIQNGSSILVLQPAYDTYTDHYERDGFLQSDASNVSAGVGGSTFSGLGTLWWFNGQSLAARPPGTTGGATMAASDAIDWGANGLNDVPNSGIAGNETQQPFPNVLEALRIRVRVEDPNTQLLEQMSAVVYFRE